MKQAEQVAKQAKNSNLIEGFEAENSQGNSLIEGAKLFDKASAQAADVIIQIISCEGNINNTLSALSGFKGSLNLELRAKILVDCLNMYKPEQIVSITSSIDKMCDKNYGGSHKDFSKKVCVPIMKDHGFITIIDGGSTQWCSYHYVQQLADKEALNLKVLGASIQVKNRMLSEYGRSALHEDVKKLAQEMVTIEKKKALSSDILKMEEQYQEDLTLIKKYKETKLHWSKVIRACVIDFSKGLSHGK